VHSQQFPQAHPNPRKAYAPTGSGNSKALDDAARRKFLEMLSATKKAHFTGVSAK
jgi:hypothetical protein